MLAFTLVVPLLLALSVTNAPRDAAPRDAALRKCRNPLQKEPVIFVDGLATVDSAYKRLTTNDLRSVEVICLNPVDSTVMVSGSNAMGIGAIVAWTKLGPFAQLEPALTAVLEAQRSHFARTGTFSRELAPLQLPKLPAHVKVALESTSDGWSARAWIDRRFSPRCFVTDASVAKTDMRTNGVVSCSDG